MVQSDKGFRKTMLFMTIAVAVLTVVSFFFFDRPAAWFAYGYKETFLHAGAKSLSLLANHTLVYALAAVGFCLGGWNLAGSNPKPWAVKVLYVCMSALVAIALTESVKYVFGRCRPELLFEKDEYGFTWFTSKYVLNSFPSGHTTRIFALCTSLGLLFRRLAAPLLTLAFLVGVSRVFALKHYPSDVLVGMFFGVFTACWVYVLWLKTCSASPDHAGEKRIK